jgi:predicted transcriptional regulator
MLIFMPYPNFIKIQGLLARMVELEDLQKIRNRLGITQKELARNAQVSQSLIAKIEAGRIDPAYSKAKQIIESLNTLQKDNVKAEALMNKSIITVTQGDSLKKAILKMKKYGISQMPVIHGKEIVGLVSESIILEGLTNSISQDAPVKEIMKDAPPTITKAASDSLVTNLLREYPIVLVSERGKLIGQITKSDILMKAFK